MNDIFIEQLVKKKRTLKDNLIFIFMIFLAIATPAVLLILAVQTILSAYFVYISFFLLMVFIWLIWYVRSNQNIEYEYQMIQDTLVVSKIYAKRRRKHIIKIDVRTFDVLDKGENEEASKTKFSKVYQACADINDENNTYYAIYNHSVYGKCAIIFTPNEKILNSMKPYLKKDIVLKLFYNRG